ncbi:uncharacterized protein [Heliangelus exortis]|uniref:uncharacterized protein isoform X4 n=1 Tax=Heliangelus exortis TaxID=472823 RepID=UPI003A8E8A60
MQDTSLGLICMGTPASIPHWVIAFCLPKFPLQFQVDVGFSFTSSPNLLCSVAACCYAAAAFQPRGGCIAVVAGGNHVSGVPPEPLTVPCCHTSLKQERDEQKAGFPGETSSAVGRGNRVLPVGTSALNSPGVAAISEQPAAGQEASDTSLHSGFSLPHPNSLSRGSQSRGEVLLLLTPISPQVLAWQACSRASSSCWCRSCKHPSSSRHCWRAWPVTPSPTSTFSHTAWCRWVRPCTSSCSGHRPTSAPSATTTPTCHFLRVTPGCPAPLVFPTSPWITKRCPPPLVATPCECHQLQEQPLHYTAMAQIFIAEAPDILKVYRRETF